MRLADTTNLNLRRLDALVDEAMPVLEKNVGRPLEYRPPATPVSEGEAAGFFRSIDSGFFDLEMDCLCIPRLMRPSTGFSYPLLSLLTRTSSTVVLWREWLTHAAVPALLHFEYGYEGHDIALDIDAFDALVFSSANQPLIAVEAKKTAAELRKTVSEMSALVTRPFRLRRAPRLSNAEQKARSLLALRPRFFLGVAPGEQCAYSVTFPNELMLGIAAMEPTALEDLRCRRVAHVVAPGSSRARAAARADLQTQKPRT